MSNIDLKVQNWNQKKEITFDELVKAVKVTSEASQASALKAINRSVRELRRQIGTNLHIRVGLSRDPEKCLSPFNNGSDSAQLQIREPYTFEFLGLKPQDVVTESDLENALIRHLQEFLLEFGKGMTTSPTSEVSTGICDQSLMVSYTFPSGIMSEYWH